MAVTPVPLTQLDPAAVSAAQSETVQRLQEAFPQLELRRGVLAELVAYAHAVLDTQRQTYTDALLAARSLKALLEDPAGADPDLVDDVLSNFRVTRQAGVAAAGTLTVVVADDVTVTISQGSVWQANGRQFVTPRVFVAKAEAGQVVTPGDRVFVPAGDNFSFTIDVVATDVGDAAVKKDTLVLPDVAPPGFVTSYAAQDFSAGTAAETNEALLARLQQGIAAPALSNRGNMAAALRSQPAFAGVVASSVIGHGDPELTRAFHSILPLATTGRCDWYVRTQAQVAAVTLTKTATLVFLNPDGTGVWQFGISRDDAPGFYEVSAVRPADLADPTVDGYEILEDVRGLDLTGPGFVPDLVTATEAAYSAYSTTVVRFLDTTDHGGLAVGAKRDYTLSAVCLPLVGDIQAYAAGRDVRPYGGDCLVKAPVPCFTTVNLTINKTTGQADPDVDAVRQAVCGVVNGTGFTGAVFASLVQDAVAPHLAAGQATSAVDMLGRIRYPDGTTVYRRDGDVLTVPNDPAGMVTPRTVQFFSTPDDVGVTVVTRPPAGV